MLRASTLASLAGLAFYPAITLAQTDVTTPGDAIVPLTDTAEGGPNGGPGASPGGEPVADAIGNTTQKYLNFGDPNPPGAPGEGSGFYVVPSLGAGVGGTVVTGLRLYTANDAVERDPATYFLEGTNGDPASDPWEFISSGDLALPAGRNAGGGTAIDPLVQFNQEVSIDNTAAYTSYRLIFPTLKGPSQNSMQIAEVELLGRVVPEPASLAAVGLLGLGALARRSRRI